MAHLYLEPFVFLKIYHAEQSNGNTGHYDYWVAVDPLVFRHGEIHTVPADQKGQRQEDGSEHCKKLHDRILTDIHFRLVGFPHLGNIISQI